MVIMSSVARQARITEQSASLRGQAGAGPAALRALIPGL